MSKLGGWHSCYNSDRAISNELGGKWELIESHTFTQDEYESFEFPTDIDGNPLNLNGIFVEFMTTQNHTSATVVTLKTENVDRVNISGATAGRMYVSAVCNNGACRIVRRETAPDNETALSATRETVIMNTPNINSFTVAVTGQIRDNQKINIYVLRGV